MKNIKIIVRSKMPRKKKKKYKKILGNISCARLIWMASELQSIEVHINSEGGSI